MERKQKTKRWSISKGELDQFRRGIGLPHKPSAHYSYLFLVQLFVGHFIRALHTYAVVDEVRALESVGRPTNTKPASRFKHSPLQGFWHKHYTHAGFIAKNIGVHWDLEGGGNRRLDEVLRRFFRKHEGKLPDEGIAIELAHIITAGAFEERSLRKKITGEWIVYAEEKGERFYLTLACHRDGESQEDSDKRVYDRIRSQCREEFPFLFQDEDGK